MMNICRNCKWAEWAMTNHNPPRVNKRQYGKCLYPMDRVAVPVSIYRNLHTNPVSEASKRAIWFTDKNACRVWESKA
jgi:hypothetical protein